MQINDQYHQVLVKSTQYQMHLCAACNLKAKPQRYLREHKLHKCFQNFVGNPKNDQGSNVV